MKIKRTSRGFQLIEFTDIYGTKCSLQQSSLAKYVQPGSSAVWLGPDDPNPKILIAGEGWKPVPFHPDTSFTTRAHLDRRQVKSLVKHLQNWLDYGRFDKPRNRENV
jgi:hypothetical protein